MWGLTSPPRPSGRGSHPCTRGRTESCTLRILTDAFTGAHGEKGEKVRSEKEVGEEGEIWMLHRKWLIYP